MKTLDEALNYIMPFGKYGGKTVGDIYSEDPQYLSWVWDTFDDSKWPKLMDAIRILELKTERPQ
jgi:uncharacterized protein (DUF3820 family)